MYLSVGDHHKALEIMAENGWIDRSKSNTVTYDGCNDRWDYIG